MIGWHVTVFFGGLLAAERAINPYRTDQMGAFRWPVNGLLSEKRSGQVFRRSATLLLRAPLGQVNRAVEQSKQATRSAQREATRQVQYKGQDGFPFCAAKFLQLPFQDSCRPY